jgi:hypothetical protein
MRDLKGMAHPVAACEVVYEREEPSMLLGTLRSSVGAPRWAASNENWRRLAPEVVRW